MGYDNLHQAKNALQFKFIIHRKYSSCANHSFEIYQKHVKT